MPSKKHPSRILIITSSAGGGHVSASHALKQKLLREDPQNLCITKDLLLDWLPSCIGGQAANLWNRAQMQGNVAALQWMGSRKTLVDKLLFLPTFFRLFFTLRNYHPNRVIDTQPICTQPLVKALRLYNKVYKKNLVLEKFLTDVPSENAGHFLYRIRNLSKQDRKWVRIIATEPSTSKGESPASFWQTQTNLPMEHIHISPPVIREGFLPYIGKARKKTTFPLCFSYEGLEKTWLQSRLESSTSPSFSSTLCSLTLQEKDCLITIVLGLRPPEKALLQYTEALQEFFLLHPEKRAFCFLCCGSSKDLQKQILQRLETKKRSKTLFFPILLQSCSTIAALFHRSNINCTKSGGQTTMELLSVATGEIWIHKESTGKKTSESPFGGIPCWEKNNAELLMKKKEARLVTPKTFTRELLGFFH